MSRLPDDYDPSLVPAPDDDGPPTRDIKLPRSLTEAPGRRDPAAKLDLDRAEELLDLPAPGARQPPSA